LDFFERRMADIREHGARAEYERQLTEWTSDLFGSPDLALPVGSAYCVECGRNDLLSVSTVDGRRVLLQDGAGRWEIKNELARIVPDGGAYSDHNCRRGVSE
jgi:hypothetical protein